MSKRIAVVGSIVLDFIRGEEKKEIRSFGGIVYSVVALSRLMPDAEILPVSFIGKGEAAQLEKLISPLRNVSLDFVREWERTNLNEIRYPRRGARVENFKKFTPPIPFDRLKPLLDSNAILVNFIKNDDILSEDLKSLSFSYKGLLYMDVHSLLREVSPSGRFRLRHLSNWILWASLPDIIQMNRSEAHMLTGLRSKNMEELKHLSGLILNQGPRVVTVTLSQKGSLTLWREGSEIKAARSPAMKVKVLDPTGAGDTYGAAFLSATLRGMTPPEASDYANRKAAQVVEGPGLEPLFLLKP